MRVPILALQESSLGFHSVWACISLAWDGLLPALTEANVVFFNARVVLQKKPLRASLDNTCRGCPRKRNSCSKFLLGPGNPCDDFVCDRSRASPQPALTPIARGPLGPEFYWTPQNSRVASAARSHPVYRIAHQAFRIEHYHRMSPVPVVNLRHLGRSDRGSVCLVGDVAMMFYDRNALQQHLDLRGLLVACRLCPGAAAAIWRMLASRFSASCK